MNDGNWGDQPSGPLLRSQLPDRTKGADEFAAERRLLCEIMADAIRDFLYGLDPQAFYPQSNWSIAAERWFCDRRATEPCSFIWVCQHLDIDPDAAREALRLKKARILSRQVAAQAPEMLDSMAISRCLGCSADTVNSMFENAAFPGAVATAEGWVIPRGKFEQWLENLNNGD